MNSKTYVTTSIPYVNAQPHIGFALELVQADVIARYSRLIGSETRFQTGTDENAFKNVLAARGRGITTQQLVDENSQLFRDLTDVLNVSADDFLRTTEQRHRRAVRRFWEHLRPDDVYSRSYRGLYCTGCEDFYLERDLVDGRCPDHGTEPVLVEEKNHFFRLSAYQTQIEELLITDRIKVIPAKRKNEVLSFVRSGLQDISVSRAAERSGGWGIPVPADPTHVIYVWIDALINYISGLGYGDGDDWQTYWRDGARKVHVIGKNVWKFHAVYWPALLLSAGLPLPDEIVVHGFLTVNGQKIGKSLGNAVDPFDCVDRYGTDGVRYYLLRAISPFEDGDFSAERLRVLYNTDLANGLGNLLSRVTTLCERACYGRHDCTATPDAPEGYHETLRRYEFGKALEILWQIVTRVNQDIERQEPWKALKRGDCVSLRRQLRNWLCELHRVAHWLAPFLTDASKTILGCLSNDSISAAKPLFPRAHLRPCLRQGKGV